MAKARKRSRERQCGDKIAYPDKAAAIATSLWRKRKFGALLRGATAYRCPHCGAWHVGHRPRRRR